MSKRFFTSDFHFGMSLLLDQKIMKQDARPFKSVEKMNTALLRTCFERAKEDDTIIHLGDLACYKQDRDSIGLSVKPIEMIKKIPATFINIRGNHDLNNKVKSIADSMQIHLGKKFPNVTCGHYPSYDSRSNSYIRSGWINLCGHVHKKWKHCLDLDNSILNINVGVDVWKYNIVSEDELVKYILQVLALPKEQINKVKTINGKLTNV